MGGYTFREEKVKNVLSAGNTGAMETVGMLLFVTKAEGSLCVWSVSIFWRRRDRYGLISPFRVVPTL